ncbi:hypothetical protein HPP92_013672 [Vanilla planifolia]|uniref:Uncharacterized protein n=1 Tax=Vanilla planifolia TaxID=51239 RepID=A0A835UYV6_VANPL|nr:hypothetical protein HPP92_013672 [Vanilla planifolia]
MGLQWLATNSPSYPSLHLVRTRELVFGHLRHYMEVAKKHRGSVAEPDHYVAALNKALDKSVEEIRVTASVNPTFWPAPELDLLDQCSSEGIMARHCLPSLGWSSPYRIIPVVRAIESCKLPDFPDLSWLKRGSRTGEEVKQQKLALEASLIIYLNESCKLLKADLAAWEAKVMLQHGAGLELRELGYFIVPKWNLIFQRIYCWQLNRLTNQDVSKAYVLAEKDSFMAMDVTRNPESASQWVYGGFKECPSNSCFEDLSFHSEVSLDELIEMCCVDTFENLHSSPLRRLLGQVMKQSCTQPNEVIKAKQMEPNKIWATSGRALAHGRAKHGTMVRTRRFRCSLARAMMLTILTCLYLRPLSRFLNMEEKSMRMSIMGYGIAAIEYDLEVDDDDDHSRTATISSNEVFTIIITC